MTGSDRFLTGSDRFLIGFYRFWTGFNGVLTEFRRVFNEVLTGFCLRLRMMWSAARLCRRRSAVTWSVATAQPPSAPPSPGSPAQWRRSP